MQKFHSGYYLTIREGEFTTDEYSELCIKSKKLTLVSDNYSGKDYEIAWEYNFYWKGLEFIICADSEEIAQDILYNLHCSVSVVNGKNEFKHPMSAIKTNIDLSQCSLDEKIGYKNIQGFLSPSNPLFFYLLKVASCNPSLLNGIIKYHLSTEIIYFNEMEVNDIEDWKTSGSRYFQMRFAYAIITAYSVIEELGLEVRASNGNPSKLPNGEWNPLVLESLEKRLMNANINLDNKFLWINRGEETEIEKKYPLKDSKLILERNNEIELENEADKEYFEFMKDCYVYLPDAINYLSTLRSKISSHAVGDRIMNLSVYDVANAQMLARTLLLESSGTIELFDSVR